LTAKESGFGIRGVGLHSNPRNLLFDLIYCTLIPEFEAVYVLKSRTKKRASERRGERATAFMLIERRVKAARRNGWPEFAGIFDPLCIPWREKRETRILSFRPS